MTKLPIVLVLAAALVVGPELASVAYQTGMLLLGMGSPAVSAQSAPTDATYITQTNHAGLSAEQALSSLSDGMLKHTGGTLARAVPGTDYQLAKTYTVLASDVTNATTSYADLTGMTLSLAANTRYSIECVFRYDANATTTGVGFGWTGPASPTLTSAQMVSGLTSATIGGTTINGNDTGGVTTASVATTANVARMQGLWSNGANAGMLQLRFKSEVAIASAIIAKAGSWCRSSVY